MASNKSLLGRELKRIREQHGSLPDVASVHSKAAKDRVPTMVFSGREAVGMSLVEVAELGRDGFLQLSTMDERFAEEDEMGRMLFSGDVRDRMLMTREESLEVSRWVHRFALLASRVFLSTPCQKCCEWLLRGWNVVNESEDVDSLIVMALPYHATDEFVRLTRALVRGRTKKSAMGAKWRFLFGPAENAIPLPDRRLIASSDPAVMFLIAKTSREAASEGIPASTLFSLHMMAVWDRLANNFNQIEAKERRFRREILVDAIEGACLFKLDDGECVRDYRAACLAVILASAAADSALGLFATTEEENSLVFDAACEAISRCLADDKEGIMWKDAIGCLVTVFCTASPRSREFSLRSYSILASVPGIGVVLGKRCLEIGAKSSLFVSGFLRTAARNSLRKCEYASLFRDFLLEAPLEGMLVDLMKTLLDSALRREADTSTSTELSGQMREALEFLHRGRNAKEFDVGIRTFLSESSENSSRELVSKILMQLSTCGDLIGVERKVILLDHPEEAVG